MPAPKFYAIALVKLFYLFSTYGYLFSIPLADLVIIYVWLFEMAYDYLKLILVSCKGFNVVFAGDIDNQEK